MRIIQQQKYLWLFIFVYQNLHLPSYYGKRLNGKLNIDVFQLYKNEYNRQVNVFKVTNKEKHRDEYTTAEISLEFPTIQFPFRYSSKLTQHTLHFLIIKNNNSSNADVLF